MTDKLFTLADKVAVVTGGSANGGIGHAIALGFAQAGADIVVADIDDEGSQVTVSEVEALGRKALAVHCDISSEPAVAALFERVDQAFGRVDVLVCVPFAFPPRVQPHDLSLMDWDRVLAVNLTGYFLCAKEAIRRMLEQDSGGAILNIGSIAGASALGRGNFPYSVSKAGVHHLTKEMALEYARQGIRVNAILPAQVMTPGFKKSMLTDPNYGKEMRQRFLTGIPLGRLLNPEDFVGPALLLCSEAGAAITGILLPVDGGNLAMNAGGSYTWLAD